MTMFGSPSNRQAEPTMTWCDACRRPVFWTLTKNRKRRPVDYHPNPEGNIVLGDRVEPGELTRQEWAAGRGREVWHETVLTKGERAGWIVDRDGPLYMPHHATCPHVDKFRRNTP